MNEQAFAELAALASEYARLDTGLRQSPGALAVRELRQACAEREARINRLLEAAGHPPIIRWGSSHALDHQA